MIIISDDEFTIRDNQDTPPVVPDAEFIRGRSAGIADTVAAVERNIAAGLPPLHGLVSEDAPKP